jgi:hypothetical protein
VETAISALFPLEFAAEEDLITKTALSVCAVEYDRRGLTANSTYAFLAVRYSGISSSWIMTCEILLSFRDCICPGFLGRADLHVD